MGRPQVERQIKALVDEQILCENTARKYANSYKLIKLYWPRSLGCSLCLSRYLSVVASILPKG